MRDLRGKVAVVTGGAGGIGKALCEELLAEGAKVVVADVQDELLAATTAELEGQGEVIGARGDVTDAASMEIVRRTLNNEVNTDLVRRLQNTKTNARPVHGNWMFAAEKIESPDRGFVGEPVGVDLRIVNEMLDAGIMPVITPIATGADGQLYNVNADSAAAFLAKELKVRKFALVSDVPGLLRDPEDPASLMSTLKLSDVAALKADGTISGGMLPKIEGCERAIEAGVKKVHLVDGRMPHSLLLEIFTREGVGTEITE
jgi:acetylglutamate kinase